MPRLKQGRTVLEATIARLEEVYAEGHRVVQSFSGGKDSLVVLECAIIAATRTNRLPVEIVMRDEELGFPDHYEFCERTANRPEVDFTWIVAGEPHWLFYDRECPFWWSFDNRLDPAHWVRRPPPFATYTDAINIGVINNAARFPPPDDGNLIVTMGLRAQESRRRMMGVASAGGWLMGPDPKTRVAGALPIYDWTEKDVWHAIAEFGWDLPSSYAKLYRAGLPNRANRTGAWLNPYAAPTIPLVYKAFPKWFHEVVYPRFPGLEAALKQGDKTYRPQRLEGETWQECFWRTCVEQAPEWIAERSQLLAGRVVTKHLENAKGNHDPWPFSDTRACFVCGANRGSWEQLANSMFGGDPFSETAATGLPYAQPQQFRPELAGTPAGMWGRNGREHPG